MSENWREREHQSLHDSAAARGEQDPPPLECYNLHLTATLHLKTGVLQRQPGYTVTDSLMTLPVSARNWVPETVTLLVADAVRKLYRQALFGGTGRHNLGWTDLTITVTNERLGADTPKSKEVVG